MRTNVQLDPWIKREGIFLQLSRYWLGNLQCSDEGSKNDGGGERCAEEPGIRSPIASLTLQNEASVLMRNE